MNDKDLDFREYVHPIHYNAQLLVIKIHPFKDRGSCFKDMQSLPKMTLFLCVFRTVMPIHLKGEWGYRVDNLCIKCPWMVCVSSIHRNGQHVCHMYSMYTIKGYVQSQVLLKTLATVCEHGQSHGQRFSNGIYSFFQIIVYLLS